MPEITGMKVGQNELPKPQDLHGRVILVSFWATWCGPCVAKLPEIAELQRKCRARGLVVIGVHASQNADGLANFVDDHPLEFPIVLDDGGTEKRYAVTQYPTYFLVDRRGNVMFAAHSTPPSEAMISAALDAASETQAELDGP
jgi:thiol-disulfide isomerase/thioredoxin